VKLKIRRVQVSDIGAMHAMTSDFADESKLAYPHIDKEEIDARMFDLLGNIDNPECVFLIAYDGKKPAGFYVGWVGNKPYSKPRRVGVAQELYVVPEKRSGVVGLHLMEEAAKLSLERGAEGFECIGSWEKQPDGSYGGTFTRWEKLGFKPYVTYGYMTPEEFMPLVQRFTRRDKAA